MNPTAGASAADVAVSTRPRVVIVGAGFGGLEAARKLAGGRVDVLLLDRTNYQLFTPLLYQVATASLEPEQIAQPVRTILHGIEGVTFRVATVRDVNLERRTLETDVGALSYDYLILAAGSTTNYFGLDSPEAKGLKDLPEAITLHDHILSQCEQAAWETDPERRQALLTFLVVGGGPTGVEMAGALSELVQVVLPRDFPMLNFREARVILLEAMDALLTSFRPKLQRAALRDLRAKGVDVRFGARVAGVVGERVELAGGATITARTLMWAAGVRAADLAVSVDAKRTRGGRLVVDQSLRLPGHPEVFVIGDMAGFEQDGQPLPWLAPVAIQQGRHAAASIRRAVAGSPPGIFRYRNRGTMATIGRNSAVAQIGPLAFSGFLAWLAWVGLHLMWIIGFRNRLLVLVNWMWNYFRYDRAARIVIPGRDVRAVQPTAPVQLGVLQLPDPPVPVAAESPPAVESSAGERGSAS